MKFGEQGVRSTCFSSSSFCFCQQRPATFIMRICFKRDRQHMMCIIQISIESPIITLFWINRDPERYELSDTARKWQIREHVKLSYCNETHLFQSLWAPGNKSVVEALSDPAKSTIVSFEVTTSSGARVWLDSTSIENTPWERLDAKLSLLLAITCPHPVGLSRLIQPSPIQLH